MKARFRVGSAVRAGQPGRQDAPERLQVLPLEMPQEMSNPTNCNHIYIYSFVYIHVFILYISICTYIHTYTYTYAYVYILVGIYVYVYVICICTCICMYNDEPPRAASAARNLRPRHPILKIIIGLSYISPGIRGETRILEPQTPEMGNKRPRCTQRFASANLTQFRSLD